LGYGGVHLGSTSPRLGERCLNCCNSQTGEEVSPFPNTATLNIDTPPVHSASIRVTAAARNAAKALDAMTPVLRRCRRAESVPERPDP